MLQPKNRTNSDFIQSDKFLNIIEILGIPTYNDISLTEPIFDEIPFRLAYDKLTNKLKIFNSDNIWVDATPIDLTNYYNKTEINSFKIEVDSTKAEIYLKNPDGTIISTINVGFLNNEGTKFEFNDTTNTIDLINDDDEILTSIPVSSLITNVITQIIFDINEPYILKFINSNNQLINSIEFNIENIKNLQKILDEKESLISILPIEKGGTGLNNVKENCFYIGGLNNSLIERTPEEILSIINAQKLLSISNGLTNVNDILKVVSVSNERIIVGVNGIDLAQTPVSSGTYTKVTVDNYGRIISASQILPEDINILIGLLGNLTTNGLIYKISNTEIVTKNIVGTSGNITSQIDNDGNIKINLVPTPILSGNYNSVDVDEFGRIINGEKIDFEFTITDEEAKNDWDNIL